MCRETIRFIRIAQYTQSETKLEHCMDPVMFRVCPPCVCDRGALACPESALPWRTSLMTTLGKERSEYATQPDLRGEITGVGSLAVHKVLETLF